MKKTDSSFKTLGLITLFLMLAMVQISYAIVMLSSQSGKAKIDAGRKTNGINTLHSVKTEKVLLSSKRYK